MRALYNFICLHAISGSQVTMNKLEVSKISHAFGYLVAYSQAGVPGSFNLYGAFIMADMSIALFLLECCQRTRGNRDSSCSL